MTDSVLHRENITKLDNKNIKQNIMKKQATGYIRKMTLH